MKSSIITLGEKMKKIKLIIIVLIIMLFGTIYLLYVVSNSRSFQFFGGLVSKVETTEKIIALTFDDGPGKNTEKILKILSEEDVKATFFLTGGEIEQNFEYATQIVEAGHEIGNHSYSHQRMVFRSYSFIKQEIEETDKLIREIGYEGDIHFRPPYGKRLLFLPHYLNQHNRYTIFWNIEPESYKNIADDSEEIVNYVLEKIEPGSIILLHVMYENRKESLNAVRPLIIHLKNEGYEFVTISELLEFEK